MNGFARVACWLVVILLTGLMFYAYATGDVVADQLHVWNVIWGIYVWADAYSGFLLFSCLIFAFERKLGVTVGLFLLACCTGNMVNAAWLLWRGPALFRNIASSNRGA